MENLRGVKKEQIKKIAKAEPRVGPKKVNEHAEKKFSKIEKSRGI